MYDNNYNQCTVNPNVWVGFGGDSNAWDNVSLPASDIPMPAIFGFWDDLNPVNDNCNEYCSGEVYYHGNEERFVVWFNEVAHWWTNFEDSFYTFQVVMFPSGEFQTPCALIIGKRKDSTNKKTSLNEFNNFLTL